jgi:hypothetical protein
MATLLYVIVEIMKEAAPEALAELKNEFDPQSFFPENETPRQYADKFIERNLPYIERRLGRPMSAEERSEALKHFQMHHSKIKDVTLSGVLEGLFVAKPKIPEKVDQDALEIVFERMEDLAGKIKAEDPILFYDKIIPEIGKMENLLSRWVRESKPEVCTAILLHIIMLLRKLV